MEIVYCGHSCFLLKTEAGTRIVTDPYTGVGYEMTPVAADYVTCSHFHFDHGYTEGVRGAREVIAGAGEFVRGDVKIEGFAAFHDDVGGKKRGADTVYVSEADGLRVCHMGDIGEPCTPALAEKLGKIDVLLVPVGGTYTVDAKGALEYIGAIAPQVAVPMHYRSRGCTLDIDPVDVFVREAEKTREVVFAHGSSLQGVGPYRGKIVVLERVNHG